MGRKKSVINPGDRFGRLSIVREIQPHIDPKSGRKFRKFECVCDCGGVTEVALYRLRNGNSKSCGCFSKEISSQIGKLTTHGLAYHPLYNTWYAMIRRCYNKKMKHYKDYGGRGIKVCERWINSLPNFIEDMGERPEGMTLDRIDNDGNYEPSNCKWSTDSEQLKNRRPYKRKKNMKT